MGSAYRIGVDGGGTKTECILVDAAGGVVASHLAPGCNPSIVGTEQARLIVTDALCALLADLRKRDPAGSITETLLCMAGSPTFWTELAGTLAEFGRVRSVDDSRPVLELATGGAPGLVLHAGTGSFVAARAPDGSRHYAGGLGWRFDDPGSGYDIGRQAVARGLLELQGWAPESRLAATVRAHAQLGASADAATLTRHFYQHAEPNRHIAALTPAVLRLANEGDAVALDLIVGSAAGLVALATRVATKLFAGIPLDTVPAGLSGPILTHPLIVPALAARTPLPLLPIEGRPIDGVQRLLLRGGD